MVFFATRVRHGPAAQAHDHEDRAVGSDVVAVQVVAVVQPPAAKGKIELRLVCEVDVQLSPDLGLQGVDRVSQANVVDHNRLARERLDEDLCAATEATKGRWQHSTRTRRRIGLLFGTSSLRHPVDAVLQGSACWC